MSTTPTPRPFGPLLNDIHASPTYRPKRNPDSISWPLVILGTFGVVIGLSRPMPSRVVWLIGGALCIWKALPTSPRSASGSSEEPSSVRVLTQRIDFTRALIDLITVFARAILPTPTSDHSSPPHNHHPFQPPLDRTGPLYSHPAGGRPHSGSLNPGFGQLSGPGGGLHGRTEPEDGDDSSRSHFSGGSLNSGFGQLHGAGAPAGGGHHRKLDPDDGDD